MATQELLFSEPSIAETGVWCNLSEGIDPADWAILCRYIGTLSQKDFVQLKSRIMPKSRWYETQLQIRYRAFRKCSISQYRPQRYRRPVSCIIPTPFISLASHQVY
jgi:hypothetical protein